MRGFSIIFVPVLPFSDDVEDWSSLPTPRMSVMECGVYLRWWGSSLMINMKRIILPARSLLVEAGTPEEGGQREGKVEREGQGQGRQRVHLEGRLESGERRGNVGTELLY